MGNRVKVGWNVGGVVGLRLGKHDGEMDGRTNEKRMCQCAYIISDMYIQILDGSINTRTQLNKSM